MVPPTLLCVRRERIPLLFMTMATQPRQTARPARTIAIGASLVLIVCALGGCSSPNRPDGPPQARAYAPTVWQGTPAALNSPRFARDGR